MKVYRGEASLQDFKNVLQKTRPKRVFLIRGTKSYEVCGAKRLMDNLFRDIGSEVFEFFDFVSNPKFEQMQIGLKSISIFKPDIIIAVGGGSVLDMAKLIRFFYSYSGDPVGTKFSKDKELIPLLVLPTTAGTGSEVTHFAVMYYNKKKYSVTHNDIIPDFAFIYPPFTYDTPPYLTACAGFDALAQAFEAYWNVNATNESDEYSLKAIKLIYPNLPLAVNFPTTEYRNHISEGAFWAGKAINITKTTAPHACSYFFTLFFGIPHGHAVALTFPFFINYNAFLEYSNISPMIKDHLKYNQKLSNLFSLLNIDIESVDKTFNNYLHNIQLGKNILGNFSYDLFSRNINIQRLQNNPKVISLATLKDLYLYLTS